MNTELGHIIKRNKLKWWAIIFIEFILISWIIGLLVNLVLFQFSIPISMLLMFVVSTIIGAIACIFYYSRRITDMNVMRLINRQFDQVEESAHLLLVNENELNFVGQLQRSKAEKILLDIQVNLTYEHRLFTRFFLFLIVFFSYAAHLYLLNDVDDNSPHQMNTSVIIDSTKNISHKIQPITVDKINIHIQPPSYTKLAKYSQNSWQMKVTEHSIVRWEIQFNNLVAKAEIIISNGKLVPLKNSNNIYTASISVIDQGYYELNYIDTLGNQYASEFYKIEVIKDASPIISIEGISQYAEFDYDASELVDFEVHLTDDFGLNTVDLIATIAKGSGESVKFREQKLIFNNSLLPNTKDQRLFKTISFSKMDMEPGDELYFYVEAHDNKYPAKNISRSETYFLVLRDTATYEFSLEGNLGVDLMPEYFRSQRQIIIDTEKLIATKNNLVKHTFNSTSNELGFDQKALRLKYGQFMGEEDDSGIATIDAELEIAEMSEGQDDENPLKGYTHDHDNENEHNLVDDDAHEINEEGEIVSDPLEEFQHAHDTEEVATFLTNTIKGKLKAAMNLMWDSELYLRLFQPEKSLPYQYKALKLIKEIKNHARIYVHRIGFDPPPLKEETRLSGDLDEVNSKSFAHYHAISNSFQNIESVIAMLNEGLVQFEFADRKLFIEAGKEMAMFAINSPQRYLTTLQLLKQLSVGDSVSGEELQKLNVDLNTVLPEKMPSPSNQKHVITKLQKQFYQQLLEGKRGQ